jgi:hypothetical protein
VTGEADSELAAAVLDRVMAGINMEDRRFFDHVCIVGAAPDWPGMRATRIEHTKGLGRSILGTPSEH